MRIKEVLAPWDSESYVVGEIQYVRMEGLNKSEYKSRSDRNQTHLMHGFLRELVECSNEV